MKLLKHALNRRNIQIVFFSIYLCFMIWMTLLSRTQYPHRVVRMELFWAFRRWLAGSENGFAESIQYIMNILFFVPFGFLFPQKKSVVKVLLFAFFTSLFIEISQYIYVLGECEIDDLISNTLGAFIGSFVYKFVENIQESRGD